MDKVKYWLDIVDEDIKTADAMFQTRRFIYVGFMCHQVVEKVLKAAVVSRTKTDPPYIHNLTKLARISGLMPLMNDEQRDFLDWVEPLNIEARYPNYKNMLYHSLSEQQWTEILARTKEFVVWTKQQLSTS